MGDQETDMDIYSSVQKALQGFSEETHDSSLNSDEMDNFIDTLANPKEMVQYYKKEMKQLQKEIASLEDKLETDKQKLLRIPATLLDEIRSHVSGGAGSVEKDEELKAIFEQLKMQVSFSRIVFTDATVEVIQQSPNQTVTSHHLEGNCLGLDIAADFQVTETKVPEGEAIPQILAGQETRAVVTKLKATVDEQVRWELDEIIKEMEKMCALEPFLNGYAQYAEWFRHREKTLRHFKKQYPTAVTLPQGSTGSLMQFSHPEHNGAVYMLSWTIHTCLSGRTEPSIDLHVKASTHMSQIDEKHTLKSAPDEFQKMMARLGVEKALDSIIQAVAT